MASIEEMVSNALGKAPLLGVAEEEAYCLVLNSVLKGKKMMENLTGISKVCVRVVKLGGRKEEFNSKKVVYAILFT